MVAAHRDAGRVNLRVARIGEQRPALVRAPRRRDVRVHRVGRQVVGGAVAAGRQQHRVRGVLLDLAGHQVAADDAPRLAVDDDEVEHLAAREKRHRAGVHLPHQRLVRAEQQLLAGLAARVERARHLRAAERPVVEQPAVLARERHALRDALVDDVHRQLREPIDVGLACAEVAALDRVVEEAVDAVAVVLVVLRGVDAALRGDAVRASRAVVNAEAEHVVAQLAEARRRRRAGQARADDDDRELALVGGVDQLHFELVPVPLVGQRPARHLRVERHDRDPEEEEVERNAEEAGRENHGERPPDPAQRRRPARAIDAERLQRAGDAVPQVEADDRHAQQIEDHVAGMAEDLGDERQRSRTPGSADA